METQIWRMDLWTVGGGENGMNGESSIDIYIYILSYVKWVSLVAQLVKNLPEMWEALV